MIMLQGETTSENWESSYLRIIPGVGSMRYDRLATRGVEVYIHENAPRNRFEAALKLCAAFVYCILAKISRFARFRQRLCR